jgi:predicted transposase YbfD/YdcC
VAEMLSGTPKEVAARVDKKSEELINEFRAHLQEVQTKHPEFTDERKIFEGWAIQKIAGLQGSVSHLAEQI